MFFAALFFPFVVPLIALKAVRSKVTATTVAPAPDFYDPADANMHYDLPVLHEEVRVETLDGGHRTIILKSKNHR